MVIQLVISRINDDKGQGKLWGTKARLLREGSVTAVLGGLGSEEGSSFAKVDRRRTCNLSLVAGRRGTCN